MVISVLVEILFNNKEKTFDYLVSKDLEDKIEIGKRVLVPFGKQSLEGFIIDIKKNSEYDLKEITSIIDEEPILNEELLNLGKELKKDLVCNLISIYQAMLPSGYKASAKTNINVKKEKYVKLANIKEAQEFITTSKAQKQIEVVEDLLKNKKSLKSKYQSNIIKVLKDKGLVIEEEKEKYRLDNSYKIEPLLKLNEYQEEAINQIENSKKDVILLNGVTGSGKTEIYMHLINKQISLGKTAIMLVPEISLTPQIINRFKVHFGNKIAVFHSALSESEKYDEYRKIRRGEVSIVIGARSAIFTPLKNIGIIIIDEEHSSTYKQEHNPRYNAIDVAIIRGKYHNAKVVLGSATPQIESYARGKKGYYELVSLTKRANNASLPKVTIVDMKNEVKKGNSLFSEILREIGLNTFSKDERTSQQQAIYCEQNNLTVSKKNLQPGDILFYNNTNCSNIKKYGHCSRALENGMHVHHVAIYIGDGKIMESTSGVNKDYEHAGVRIYNLSQSSTYYVYSAARVLGIKRPVTPENPDIPENPDTPENPDNKGDQENNNQTNKDDRVDNGNIENNDVKNEE